jgi:hypothetical protein
VIISLKSVNYYLIFVMVKGGVLFEIRTVVLNVIRPALLQSVNLTQDRGQWRVSVIFKSIYIGFNTVSRLNCIGKK